MTVYTIGHSNHEPDAFLALVREHGLATIVDVRSAPYSRYAPHFNRDAFARILAEAGITYVWAGDTLGGRPDDPACYRDGVIRTGNIDYAAMARRESFQHGISELRSLAAHDSVAVMCSEEDPHRCHRHRLLEPSLREHGVVVRHIRGDGSLEEIDPEATIAAQTPRPQLALAGFTP